MMTQQILKATITCYMKTVCLAVCKSTFSISRGENQLHNVTIITTRTMSDFITRRWESIIFFFLFFSMCVALSNSDYKVLRNEFTDSRWGFLHNAVVCPTLLFLFFFVEIRGHASLFRPPLPSDFYFRPR